MSTYIVGRDALAADLVVPARYSTVSRSHARLSRVSDDVYLIEDLNSSGGTRILQNGKWTRINRAEVRLDDPIRLTDYETSVRSLLATAAVTRAFQGPLSDARPPIAPPPPQAPMPPNQPINAAPMAPQFIPHVAPHPFGAANRPGYDIFVSYAQADQHRVGPLVQLLERHGWRVFWDREIRPGQQWADFIESTLKSSKVAIVVWSDASTRSEWVKAEAMRARELGIIIPVRIDNSAIPMPFGIIQTADINLSGKLDPGTHVVRQFLETVAARLMHGPSPSAPIAPYGFASSSSVRSTTDLDLGHILFGQAGRINRKQYWIGLVLTWVATLVVAFVMGALFAAAEPNGDRHDAVAAALVITFLVTCYSYFALFGKRLRDFGRSGAWSIALVLIVFLSTMGGAVANPTPDAKTGLAIFNVLYLVGVLILGIKNGDPGANKYGPPP